MGAGLKVVFLGMACGGSAAALAALLAGGVEVRGVVVAGLGGGGGGVAGRGGAAAGVAGGAGVPVLGVGGMGRETIAEIAGYGPDAVVAGCFPWRVPGALLDLPRFGCFNVHPSLLPTGRGPDPVFWTLRRGEPRTGATVHRMDGGFDTGPIVAQEAVDVPPGVRAPDLERRLMEIGGRLAVGALPRLAAGELVPTPQPEADATRAPIPTAGDWAMPTTLPAAWAYAFARGVAPLGGPLAVLIGATGERRPVRDALGWGSEAMDAAVVDEGEGVIRVRFRPGWVRLRVEG